MVKEELTPIDLIKRYKNSGFKEEFEHWVEEKAVKVKKSTTIQFQKLKRGDVVNFYNGMGIWMRSEILGFSEDNKAYMLWDCYWAPIDLVQRGFEKYVTPKK